MSWNPDDRSKAIAFILEKSAHCELCGTADWEWEENRRAYAPVEHFCLGCYTKTVYGEDSNNSPGTTIRLIATNSVEYARRLTAEKKRFLRDAK